MLSVSDSLFAENTYKKLEVICIVTIDVSGPFTASLCNVIFVCVSVLRFHGIFMMCNRYRILHVSSRKNA